MSSLQQIAVVLGLVALGSPAAADTAKPTPAKPANVTPKPAPPGANIVEGGSLDIQPSTRAFKQITIDNPLGDVLVEGWDGTAIQIATRKHGPDEEAIDRLRISLVANPDGTVRLTTTADPSKESKPLGRGTVRIDLIVRAPRDARIDATASTGSLEVRNMDAGGELDTTSGPISVKNVSGGLLTHSVSGATSIAQAFGSVDAQTLSSNLELDSIGGERLVASANKGTIAARRVRSRSIELTTNEGKITLEAESSLRSRMVVASLRGDVDIKLHGHAGAILVRARGKKVSFGGTLQSTRPDGWVETGFGRPVSAGTSPALVELRSRYGNVNFVIVQ